MIKRRIKRTMKINKIVKYFKNKSTGLLLILLILAGTSCKKNIGYDEQSTYVSYYINAAIGNNFNKGTSQHIAWKSLSKLNSIQLKPGDTVFLANNMVFEEPLLLENINGTEDAKIVFTSYTPGNKLVEQNATINVKDVLNAVSITDCSFIELKNLTISANARPDKPNSTEREMRCGILVKSKKNGTSENLVFKNLVIKDIFYENPGYQRPSNEVRSANGTQNYGWGIRVINTNIEALIKDISIINCQIENVSHTGIKFSGNNRNIKNILVSNCKVLETGGPGIQMSGVEKGLITNNYVNRSGNNNDSRKWGRGSGLWTWGSKDVIIEKNYFLNANGPGDSAGVHIDFNCENIIIQYNFSANNAGGFCEILGNNYNCSYRYNISVNDGHRIKGKNGAFQEGKTLWLSGYVGKNKKRNGPFNSYIYNNTIYVSDSIVSKMAFTNSFSGALIMNNIFYIEGKSTNVLGDQYKPDTKGAFGGKNIVFENNLFLRPDNWPIEVPIKDTAPLFGDPKFKLKGGNAIANYTPENAELITNKGKQISLIPNDAAGLIIGLKVTNDILGNPIKGLPDIGAIEIQ